MGDCFLKPVQLLSTVHECRSDVVPRLSYASVEGIFMELVSASPVRRAANDVKSRLVVHAVALYA